MFKYCVVISFNREYSTVYNIYYTEREKPSYSECKLNVY